MKYATKGGSRMKYAQTVTKSITMYPKQWDKLRRVADEEHEGKLSRALRAMVDAYPEEATDAAAD